MNTSVGAWEITSESPDYPKGLLQVQDPFNTLYGIGDKHILAKPCLGVIGARRATPYGIAAAEAAGRIAAECGIAVISGGAMGCDFAAAEACLKQGGDTIVVAGTGPDVTYPKTSAWVFDMARSGRGCVVSAEKWGQGPRKYTFPKRNKIIAALCRCLLITEAGLPSGTMRTAAAAEALGRGLYAIPGSIFSPLSRGTNRLISQGAAIICDETSLEVQISLDFDVCRLVTQDLPKEKGRILSALTACCLRPEELASKMGEDVLTVVRTLTDYESRGFVQRLPDGRFSLTKESYLGDNRA